jgi:hypothetical protein
LPDAQCGTEESFGNPRCVVTDESADLRMRLARAETELVEAKAITQRQRDREVLRDALARRGFEGQQLHPVAKMISHSATFTRQADGSIDRRLVDQELGKWLAGDGAYLVDTGEAAILDDGRAARQRRREAALQTIVDAMRPGPERIEGDSVEERQTNAHEALRAALQKGGW